MAEDGKVLIWKSFTMDPGGALWSDEKLSLDAAPYLGILPDGFRRKVIGERIIYECRGKVYAIRPQGKLPLYLYPEAGSGGGEPVEMEIAGRLPWHPKYDDGPFFDGPFGEVAEDQDGGEIPRILKDY